MTYRCIRFKADRLHPDLSMIGWLQTNRARRGAIGRSQHPHHWTVMCLTRASLDWIIDGSPMPMRAPAWFVLRPKQAIMVRDAIQVPSEFFFFHLKDRSHRALLGMTRSETAEFRRRLRASSRKPFPASQASDAAWRSLFAACQADDADALSALRRRSAFLALAQGLLSDIASNTAAAGEASAGNRRWSDPIAQVVDWMERHPASALRTADLARLAGLGRSRFHALFLRETGTSPHAFFNQRRSETAKARLTGSTDPIAAIAAELGFPSGRVFAEVFARHTGCSPTHWRVGSSAG